MESWFGKYSHVFELNVLQQVLNIGVDNSLRRL